MSGHTVRIRPVDQKFQAVCSCRRESWRYEHLWAAEDWKAEHLRIAAENAARSASQPSLATTLKWYRAQEANEENTPDQREQWRMLADEIERRVPSKAIPEDQAGLW